jgi:N-acetylneuraminic acid mutarotase
MESEGCYDVGVKMGTTNADKRWSGAFAQIGSQVYCIGGYVLNPAPVSGKQAVASDRVQAFDIDTDTWDDTITPLPNPIAFSVAAATGGFVYVLGGLDDNGVILDTIYRFNPANNTWLLLPKTLDVGRFSYAAAAWGDEIIVCGGLTDTDTTVTANYSNRVDMINTTTGVWTSLPDLPIGRRCHTMTVVPDLTGDKAYVFGGFYFDDGGTGGVDMRDVLELDLSNPTQWIAKTDLPMDLAGHVCVRHETTSKVYILSGWSMDGIKYDVIEYDPQADLSKILMRAPRNASIGWPRFWCFAGISGERIASIGGYGGVPSQIPGTQNSGTTHFHQTYIYDLTRPDP